VPEQHEVSHADIYHKLGSLEAKLDAVISSVIDYKSTLNTDMGEAFKRIRKLEDKMIWTIGAVAGLSIVVPLMLGAINNSFHLEFKPKTEVHSVKK
jgi:hypothetical protein